MIVYFQKKCWSGVARVHIFIGIFLLIVHWGYHSMTSNVSEQKLSRNRPVPSQLSFIMRCLKSWQQTAGVNLESKKRKDFPPVFTHPNPPQISQTPHFCLWPHKNVLTVFIHNHYFCSLPCTDLPPFSLGLRLLYWSGCLSVLVLGEGLEEHRMFLTRKLFPMSSFCQMEQTAGYWLLHHCTFCSHGIRLWTFGWCISRCIYKCLHSSVRYWL